MRFLEKLVMKLYDGRTIDGLLVIGHIKEIEKVEKALSLIRGHDPVRYQRILRDLERIWVVYLFGAVGSFHSLTWTCKLDRRFVLDEKTALESIACTIVHEATHARLWRNGIFYDEDIRVRVEGVCIGSEIAFADRLPEGTWIADDAWRCRQALQPSDFSDTAMNARRRAGTERLFRELEMPEWFIKSFIGILEWTSNRWLARKKRRRAPG